MTIPAKRRAYEAALQVLYGLDATGAIAPGYAEVDEAEARRALDRYWDGLALGGDEEAGEGEDGPLEPEVYEHAERLVIGTVGELSEIDAAIQRGSRNWRLERMSRVDRSILRLAGFELRLRPPIPPALVIDRAIEAAKRYGAAESAAFVNGLLDRIATAMRSGPL